MDFFPPFVKSKKICNNADKKILPTRTVHALILEGEFATRLLPLTEKYAGRNCANRRKHHFGRQIFLQKNVTLENVIIKNSVVLENTHLKNTQIENCVFEKNVIIHNTDLHGKIVRDETVMWA